MSRRTVLVIGLLLLVGSAERAAGQGVDEEISAEQVVTAIDRAVTFLKQEQRDNGAWTQDVPNHAGGTTALCTLALLNAGVPVGDPAIQKPLKIIRTMEPERTYVVALQTMVLAVAEPKRLVPIQKNVNWLESTQITQGEMKGAWGYGFNDNTGGDTSNTQFAILALHEAERVGAKVNPQTWRRTYDYFIRHQADNGGWGYKPGGGGWKVTGSMTCAGIGSLVITSGKVQAGGADVAGGEVLCCQPQAGEEAIQRGLDWLGRNFSIAGNPEGRGLANKGWFYYYLYALERVGRLTGQRLIGGRDWYREGADYLINDARAPFDVSWQGHGMEYPQIATSLSLLFLSKGRRPVVVAKLQHGRDNDWNHHPGDLANLTAYTEKVWNLDLTWQQFDVEAATTDNLLQAPVLFLSGSGPPQLAGQEEKIRETIDRGGFLFAEICCGDQGFEQGLREFVGRVFPEPEYDLKQIPPSHPIWRAEKLVRPDSPYAGKLWAVEYGCRTCVVFSQRNLSCYWELHRLGKPTDYPPSVNQQVEDALDVGLNVLTYATGREPKHKEQMFAQLSSADMEGALGERGRVQIAKLRHGGGFDDAPGALANLLRAASQGEAALTVPPQQEIIAITEEALREQHIVFMHGRNRFQLTQAERDALKDYLERGGLLLADSICASDAFAEAFRQEMRQIFPEQQLARIPATDPMFTDQLGGFDIRTVTQRDPQPARNNEPLIVRERQVPPQLEGIQLEGRWAVVFSPLDLSCALEQLASLECRGYKRQDAVRIGLNIIIYALNW